MTRESFLRRAARLAVLLAASIAGSTALGAGERGVQVVADD
jgi:hypothetical protein